MQAAQYAISWVKDQNWAYIRALTLDRLERCFKTFLPQTLPIAEDLRQKNLAYVKFFRARPSKRDGGAFYVKCMLEQACTRYVELFESYQRHLICGPEHKLSDLRKQAMHDLEELFAVCAIAHDLHPTIQSEPSQLACLPPSLKRSFGEAIRQDFREVTPQNDPIRIAY